MHLSISLLTALPLGALAYGGAVIRSKPQQPQVPEWARQCKGKCTFTKTSTRTVWGTETTTVQREPATTSEVVIETSTSTSTLSQDTSVFSTTTVLYTTATETTSSIETDTVTVISTVTEAPATVTIGAPAGFTPVKSALSTPVKRSVEKSKGYKAAEPEVHVHDIQKCTSSKFSTVYSTKSRTRTSTALGPRSTVTSTGTTTVTTVTSVLPTPASSTVTVSSTSTITSTSTVALTSTVTATSTTTEAVGPTPTFYAACGDDNILTSVNGKYVSALYYSPVGGSMSLGVYPSAYECCVACLKSDGCMGSGWIASSVCIGATGATACDRAPLGPSFGATSTTNVGWAVSNAGCGQWWQRG